MKINEITGKSRKIIKQLHNLYTSYVLNPSKYSELVVLIYQCANSNDVDLIKEANIINTKLTEELIRILSS